MTQPTRTPSYGCVELSEATAIQNVTATDFNLPEGHVVQALEDRYIRATVLQEALEQAWPGNWAMFVSITILQNSWCASLSIFTMLIDT